MNEIPKDVLKIMEKLFASKDEIEKEDKYALILHVGKCDLCKMMSMMCERLINEHFREVSGT